MIHTILNDVKVYLDIEPDDTDFDDRVLMHINSAFVELNQLGVGNDIFRVEDNTALWDEFVNDHRVGMVKDFVYACVRRDFDPPQSSFVLSSLEKHIEQLQFRLNIAFDNGG